MKVAKGFLGGDRAGILNLPQVGRRSGKLPRSLQARGAGGQSGRTARDAEFTSKWLRFKSDLIHIYRRRNVGRALLCRFHRIDSRASAHVNANLYAVNLPQSQPHNDYTTYCLPVTTYKSVHARWHRQLSDKHGDNRTSYESLSPVYPGPLCKSGADRSKGA